MLCPALCPILLISSCPYRKQAGIMCCWLMRSKRYVLRALKASCRGSSVLSSTLNIFLPLLSSSQSVPDTRSREAGQSLNQTRFFFHWRVSSIFGFLTEREARRGLYPGRRERHQQEHETAGVIWIGQKTKSSDGCEKPPVQSAKFKK